MVCVTFHWALTSCQLTIQPFQECQLEILVNNPIASVQGNLLTQRHQNGHQPHQRVRLNYLLQFWFCSHLNDLGFSTLLNCCIYIVYLILYCLALQDGVGMKAFKLLGSSSGWLVGNSELPWCPNVGGVNVYTLTHASTSLVVSLRDRCVLGQTTTHDHTRPGLQMSKCQAWGRASNWLVADSWLKVTQGRVHAPI